MMGIFLLLAAQFRSYIQPVIIMSAIPFGLVGAILSSLVPHLPTGPTIVLVVTGLAVFSLLLAPRRGLLSARWRRSRQRRRLMDESVLADLYRMASQHPDPESAPHSLKVLRAMSAGAISASNESPPAATIW